MFTGELAESRQTEVVIRDIDERAMELLIDFAYTSQVTTTPAVNCVSLILEVGAVLLPLLVRVYKLIDRTQADRNLANTSGAKQLSSVSSRKTGLSHLQVV